MKTLWKYIVYRMGFILLQIVFVAVFALVSAMFRVPAQVTLYSGAVCLFIGLAASVRDFLNFRKKHILLRNIRGSIPFFIDGISEISRSGGLIENDYADIIISISEEMRANENRMNDRYSDMTDYYTLWAHQIKTPIAAMSLILQSEDHPRTGELREDLQSIEQYAEMVMCYIRLGSSSGDFVIKEYDLDGIIRQAVRKFSSQFIRRKIKLIYEPVRCTVITDEKWLLFVIEQVISNALKYTASGEVEISLEEPKTLCVRDTGAGIAAEDIPRIFEKGYTGCNGRADKKASGIGLYLCRLICGRLGHSITASSERGEGTKIYIGLSRQNIGIE
ncbi:MAG: sensor histidine kinase [Ruminococcus sp.]|nr:sensor histidine kinase [Ruminococcus sp.]